MASYEPVHPVDMSVYRHRFGTTEMCDIFSERARLYSWLEYEAVLARAQAACGMIPATAAEEISRVALSGQVTPERVAEIYDKVKLDTVALIRALTEKCTPESAKYVHWGSTTTDILDTGMALQLKKAHALIVQEAKVLRKQLVELAKRHRDTVMVARTHSQHALPVTFAFKVAMWIDELTNHLQRLEEVKPRLLRGKITGVVGSQAGYGTHGIEVQRHVCESLGLHEPDTSNQISRSRFQEFLFLMALLGNTLQCIAKEVWTRQRPEIAELAEGFKAGEQIGSTTLAFKRNPVLSEWILGYSKILRGHAMTMMDIVMEDERDGARVAVEYAIIPDSCLVASVALETTQNLIGTLEVNVERMRENIYSSYGFVFSEAVMMALAGVGLGKQVAHEVLYECSNRCYRERIQLRQALLEDPRVTRYFDAARLDEIMRPQAYLGTVREQVAAALMRAGE